MTTSVAVLGGPTNTSVSVLGGRPVPLRIPNLELWFKADAITGVEDGGTVATWPDSSGNGRDATSAGDPTWHASVTHGKPCLRTDGVGMYLTVDDFAESLTGKTVLVVAKSDDTPAGVEAVIAHYDTATANRSWLVGQTAIKRAQGLFSADGDTTNFKAYASGSFLHTAVNIIEAHFDTDALTLRVNGLVENHTLTTDGTVETLFNSTAVFTIGASLTTAGAASNLWDGDIYEIIVYGRALSAGELLRLERYASAKYAVSLWNPTYLTGLEAWLPADQIPALTDGGAVATWPGWEGLAAGGHDASQATAGNKPTWETAVINGRPVVRFTTDDFMTVADHADLNFAGDSMTVVLVYIRRTNATSNLRLFAKGASADGVAGYSCFGSDTSQILIIGDGASRKQVAVTHAGVDETQLLTYVLDTGVLLTGYDRGLSEATTSLVGYTEGDLASDLYVGATTTPNLYFEGDIAEIILVRGTLNTGDQKALEQWAANKYGVTLQ